MERNMEKPIAVIGTNSWGSALYEKALRGDAVDDSVIQEAVSEAILQDLLIFDTAQDYGLGKGQKMIGEFCPEDQTIISAKYTPVAKYKPGQVHASLEKDLKDFGRDSVDIYWLHLPNNVEENMQEMIELYKEGKIRHVGISNFNLEECIQVKKMLDEAGIPLYGVQNHYSLLSREWEERGLTDWCRENGVSFWAWAVLEEGILTGPKTKNEKNTIMKVFFGRKRRKLQRLFRLMKIIGDRHNITIAQVAIAYVANKGLVPICGCRKPYQVAQLKEASETKLSAKEMKKLEEIADESGAKILGADNFRSFVKKEKKAMARTSEEYKALSISEFTKAAAKYESADISIYKTCREDYPEILDILEKHNFTEFLDAGCGPAPLIGLLSEMYPDKHYTGIDLTPAMIDKAKEKKLPNADFVVGDCENLPFADESFDVIVCCESFHHYPNPQDFFNSAGRCLKKDGILFLRDYAAGQGLANFMNRVMMPLFNALGHGDVMVCTEEELREMCKKAGLTVESFEVLPGGKHKMNMIARKIKD